MSVSHIWSTQDGDNLIGYIARVSNPKNQDNSQTVHKLINYLIRHGHWSPFEMVNLCVQIDTTRDIGRQILRHRSFSYQEFSQRYQDVSELSTDYVERETRLQDTKNRQNSFESQDDELKIWFDNAQWQVADLSNNLYKQALDKGIAKEQARALLPEGLTPTRMYMNGTLRSWIHFLKARLYSGAQKEIRLIAKEVEEIISQKFPMTYDAIEEYIHE